MVSTHLKNQTNSISTSSGRAATRFGTVLFSCCWEIQQRQFAKQGPTEENLKVNVLYAMFFMGWWSHFWGMESWLKKRGIMVSICTSIPLLVYSGHYYVDIWPNQCHQTCSMLRPIILKHWSSCFRAGSLIQVLWLGIPTNHSFNKHPTEREFWQYMLWTCCWNESNHCNRLT